MTTLAHALVEAQKAMPPVEPNATNPHFRSKFVTLDHLIAKTRPVLNDHGLAIAQFPAVSDAGQPVLRTVLLHAESGERLEADTPLFLGKQDMQQLGAAVTYARRYAWSSVLGISADEDDDGTLASQVGADGKEAPRAAAVDRPSTGPAAASKEPGGAARPPTPPGEAAAPVPGATLAGDIDVSTCGKNYAGKRVRDLTKGQLGWISGRWAPEGKQPWQPKTVEQEIAQAAAQAYLDDPKASVNIAQLAEAAEIPF